MSRTRKRYPNGQKRHSDNLGSKVNTAYGAPGNFNRSARVFGTKPKKSSS